MAPHGVILWGHPPHGWNELDELVPAMASAFSRNIYALHVGSALAYPLACSDIWTGTKQIQLRSPPGGLSHPRGTIEVCSVTVAGQKNMLRVHQFTYTLACRSNGPSRMVRSRKYYTYQNMQRRSTGAKPHGLRSFENAPSTRKGAYSFGWGS